MKKYLEPLGKVLNVIDFISILETFAFWNSADKKATKVAVFIENNKRFSHSYQTVVDGDMSFDKTFSGYIGDVIGDNEKDFQVILG